jgi:type IV pilus assembly protein PilE
MYHPHLRASRGMTLIELMTVMTIVAIMAAIAIPSYRAYTVRTHRAAAKACLSEAAQFMERYYTSNMTYEGATLALACQTDNDLDEKYQISPGTPEQRTYTLSAVPQGAQAEDDSTCGTLTMTETGQRGAAGGTDAEVIARCW